MASTHSHKVKRASADTPRLLTRSGIAALRRDVKESVIWAEAELKRRAQKSAEDENQP